MPGETATKLRYSCEGLRRFRRQQFDCCFIVGVLWRMEAREVITATIAGQRTEPCFIVLPSADPPPMLMVLAAASPVSPGKTTQRARMRHLGFDAFHAERSNGIWMARRHARTFSGNCGAVPPNRSTDSCRS